MKLKPLYKVIVVCVLLTGLCAFIQAGNNAEPRLSLPYKKAGLTNRQAAAHLLSRFSFGARPGEIDAVVNMGLENWLMQQLDGRLPDTAVERRLQGYETLTMDNETIVNTYLNPGQIIRIAVKNNLYNKDSVNNLSKAEYRAQLKQLMDANGYKPPQELQRQLINQKIIHAAYGQNQLHEILTDFWFNHFNVSLTKGQSQQYVLTYERDAIRPNVMGSFSKLLEATAKHPAMLEFLDNASNVSNNNPMGKRQDSGDYARLAKQRIANAMADTTRAAKALQQAMNARKAQGLNENYAREIMELHTLGVDGGYTQKDVTEVARALTGWAPVPLYKEGTAKKLLENLGPAIMAKRGFVVEGDFVYRAAKHDEGEKVILGRKFPANGGYAEGMEVLNMLANHPSTAKFICTKLATRFVNDNPPAVLIKKMADVFLETKGNLRAVMITMVNSREFWGADALREKVKSPFEFAISAIRATNADVQEPFQIYTWCMRMGQRFYFYQAPTGFPDRATYWINTGSLLNRMNFGLAFATGKIPGVKVNLAALNNNHEPESADSALVIYSKLLLPERNQAENIKRLTAMVRDANVEQKITAAADKTMVAENNTDMAMNDDMMKGPSQRKLKVNEKAALSKQGKPVATLYMAGNTNALSQVAGIIIGSPEFQRK